jgi:hypothetical protein
VSKLADYQSKAKSCDSEAREAAWRELRETWLQIRDSYRHLADREERIEQERMTQPGLL